MEHTREPWEIKFGTQSGGRQMRFNLHSEIKRASNRIEDYTNRNTLLAHMGTVIDVSLAQKSITRMYNDAVKEVVYKEEK